MDFIYFFILFLKERQQIFKKSILKNLAITMFLNSLYIAEFSKKKMQLKNFN